jgi:hypothetical protein
MRNAGGYGHIIDPDLPGGVGEHDVFTCAHFWCGGRVEMVRAGVSGKLEVMVFRNDGTFYYKEAGFCRNCMRPICPICDGKPCFNRHDAIEKLEKGIILDPS